MKRIGVTALLMAVHIFCAAQIGTSQHYYYTTESFGPPIILIDGKASVTMPHIIKIESTTLPFKITGGTFNLRINGAIDRIAPNQVVFNITAEENKFDQLVIHLIQDREVVMYKIDGVGLGLYGGCYQENGHFIVRTKFNISSPGKPAYILEVPIHVKITGTGNISFERSYIEGTAYVYTAISKKQKVRFAKN